MKVKTCTLIAVLIFCSACFTNAETTIQPDYGTMYLGNDKFENFNRKMFKFNTCFNKYAVRPMHIVWASIMPKYGMDRILGVAENIEYPKRLISSLVQKDFKTSGQETLRFLTNSTIGLGGMFDPAKKIFNIQPADEDMGQALGKYGIKQGPYCVLPILSPMTVRDGVAKGLDTALNPSSYIAAPVLALIKFGLVLNKTSYSQSLMTTLASNYADPYDVAKTIYGLERHLKTNNFDRTNVLETDIKLVETEPQNIKEKIEENVDSNVTKVKNISPKIEADYVLANFNPQNAITDSMRTALFEIPDIDKSIWSELSIWNRSFVNRIKSDSVELMPNCEKYKFRYILNKDKNSPLAIIIPSIGEGVNSHHSECLAKIFYDEGYSVLIVGNHFQWEFIKSYGRTYYPGSPQNDVEYVKSALLKIKNRLENKYERQFKDNVLIGTSLGAMSGLFLANNETQNNTLGIIKYIAVCPPIDLHYAMTKVDENNILNENTDEHKNNVSLIASKILKLVKENKNTPFLEKFDYLPFSEEEAKIITSFIMYQKLSDLVYTLEGGNSAKKSDLYSVIDKMSYKDYAEKYLKSVNYQTTANLFAISEYIANNDNYKIYHSVNDYLTNLEQLSGLKKIAQKNMLVFDNGGHLGFLYRTEFQDMLKQDIRRRPNLRG